MDAMPATEPVNPLMVREVLMALGRDGDVYRSVEMSKRESEKLG